MSYSNKDRLALLQQVEQQTGGWREALEDLIVDAEDAVIADEAAVIRVTVNPKDVVSVPMEDANRWESAGTVTDRNGLQRHRDYRDTL